MAKDEIKNKAEQEEANAKAQNEEKVEGNEEQTVDENIEEHHEHEEVEMVEESEADKYKKEAQEARDQYLRLYSDFENFRRRTSKEKLDFMKNASEDMIVALLPIVDDFERALKHATVEDGQEAFQGFKEGVELIHNKLVKALEAKGLKPMEDAIGKEFDMDLHEAITQIPAPSEELKGKVVDVVEKGYVLNEKVIRYAKVVVGN
ncbi:nucleotide exchange factor GrpE [Algivirga pacifica]|uniref:Protein GrpE n=1 Tax=Algivirga pacifica TaxID=1162670 RepID=A0ABP9D978_9BACT